ncbi:MAG TPA: hypothetical protein VFY25_17105, partial [Anaerolineales bacterium]|nr:hypothetical protein [Anaerolineales bacterium]
MSTNLGQILKGILELLIGALASLWDLLTGRQHEHGEDHPLQYFLPGKLVLHVDHPGGLDQTQLGSLLTQPIAGLGEGRLKILDPGAILTFPLANAQGLEFSLVPVETTSPSQQDLVALLLDIYNRLKDNPIPISTNIVIRAVSPNWLLGTLNHAPRPTSPGSWPVPAAAPKADDLKFSVMNPTSAASSPLPFANEDGSGIDIAILDTAPAELDL